MSSRLGLREGRSNSWPSLFRTVAGKSGRAARPLVAMRVGQGATNELGVLVVAELAAAAHLVVRRCPVLADRGVLHLLELAVGPFHPGPGDSEEHVHEQPAEDDVPNDER